MPSWLQQIFDFVRGGPEATYGEMLLRGSLIVCSLFASVQLLTMLGTRWGERHAMRKAVLLSLLVHLCLALGGTAKVISESHFVASPEEPERIPIRRLVAEKAGEAVGGTISQAASDNAPVWQRLPGPSPVAFNRSEPGSSPGEVNPQRSRSVAQEPARIDTPRSAVVEETPVQAKPLEPSQVPLRAMSTIPLTTADEATAEARPDPTAQSRAPVRMARTPEGTSSPSTAPQRRIARSADQSRDAPTRGGGSTNYPDPATLGPGSRVKASVRRSDTGGSFQDVQGILHGIVTDAASRRPLAGATVRLDRARGGPLTATTAEDGTYELAVSETPDNSAVTASREGYVPEARNVRAKEIHGKEFELNFSLRRATESVIAIEADPEVHHLGNDAFEGQINSQFQRKSEGATWTAAFTITAEQARSRPSHATVTFLAKGIECAPQVRINGNVLSRRLAPSPDDGKFGAMTLSFDPALLREGRNQISLQTVTCLGDLDDFEFVNVQIRLTRKE